MLNQYLSTGRLFTTIACCYRTNSNCVCSLFQANEVLLFGRKLTAQEACDLGLVTAVFPDASFKEEVKKRVTEYSKLPRNVSIIMLY